MAVSVKEIKLPSVRPLWVHGVLSICRFSKTAVFCSVLLKIPFKHQDIFKQYGKLMINSTFRYHMSVKRICLGIL